ncbi:MAG: DUF5107 domain-containing protein [Chthonomonadales bacterium]
MTRLYRTTYRLPAADLGPENPLPFFRGREQDTHVPVAPNVPRADRQYLGWRTGWRVLPHRMQDGYSRQRSIKDLDAIVLENDRVKAVFLPGLGGRLVSLEDRSSGRELLARNPVLQFGNLALRNAWFSGGVEWNPGQPGHHALTCAPVFAARVPTPGGEAGLRLYEWDRVKGFLWQIDFWLPTHSPLLFVHVRLMNPRKDVLPMYWWTNIAIREEPGLRVLVPASTALCNAYRGGLGVVDLPTMNGWDITYPEEAPHAFDFFARIPKSVRPWIAAVGRDGTGFFQTSTPRLRGRKLFCWGMNPGGRRWQELLAEPGFAYIEIQAGLARTQMECLPMPAGAVWSWTEAFGPLSARPECIHSPDWETACTEADARIEELVSKPALAAIHARFARTAKARPHEILAYGSGWGALERKRASVAEEPCGMPASVPFPDDSLGEDQQPWLHLIETGLLPQRSMRDEPGALMVGEAWLGPLEASVRRPDGGHWLAWWHLGNIRMEELDDVGAEDAWRRSLEAAPNAWALRNMAILAMRRQDRLHAVELLREAWEIGPRIAALAVEYLDALLECKEYAAVLRVIRSLPEALRDHDRILIAQAKAALGTGDLDGVERIFQHEFALIREGEVSLSDLWFEWQAHLLAAKEGAEHLDACRARVRSEMAPPRSIDFRMAG